jgi:hypothetical protein
MINRLPAPLIFLLAAMLLPIVCSKTQLPTAQPPANAGPSVSGSLSTTTSGASYSYEIRSAGSKQSGTGENIDASDGAIHLVIRDGQLFVNEKGYGKLNDKDAVLIDEAGHVTVNAESRKPE